MARYTLLFRSKTTINPNKEAIPIKLSNNDNLIISMKNSLYNKYSFSQNNYYTTNINDILQKNGQKYVEYSEYTILDERKDHLERFYNKIESQGKLTLIMKFQHFHQTTIRFFLDDHTLDQLVDKYQTKRLKIHYNQVIKLINQEKERLLKGSLPLKKQVEQKQENNKQMIFHKLNHFEPFLSDLSITSLEKSCNDQNTTQRLMNMIRQNSSQKEKNLNEMDKQSQFLCEKDVEEFNDQKQNIQKKGLLKEIMKNKILSMNQPLNSRVLERKGSFMSIFNFQKIDQIPNIISNLKVQTQKGIKSIILRSPQTQSSVIQKGSFKKLFDLYQSKVLEDTTKFSSIKEIKNSNKENINQRRQSLKLKDSKLNLLKLRKQ